MGRDTYLKKVLGEDRYQKVQGSTVLMVGAGGIGCELLKNLMLSGYGTIHIVDLDTITLSNLNRQFLFRKGDIDQSKSITIKKAVESFNFHGTKLISHHGNIMDTDQFPIDWWDQFSYIFNALDNLEARRYVNKMALFLKKPVMESGTTGFDGYVQPIFPYKTECFDCQPKATPQTFPVCTIRSTPSKPIHCITWAKEFLFQQLFDESVEGDAEDLSNATDNDKELENLLKESNELVELRKLVVATGEVISQNTFFSEMVRKIFQIDIERLLLIDTLWTNRLKPIPISDAQIEEVADLIRSGGIEQRLESLIDTQVWSPLENLLVLYKSATNLQTRMKNNKFIAFDKDDEDTLDFVVTAANLRSLIFQIDTLSKFDVKQIAGNIIPAIATTNAIISGFSNLESLNFLAQNSRTDSSMVFISIRPNKYVTSATLEAPRKQCASCSVARGILKSEEGTLDQVTLEQFIDKVKSKYSYSSDISIILGKSKLIYDFDFDDNLSKSLSEIGFKTGELVLIQDEDDEVENLELYIEVGLKSNDIELPELELRQKILIEKENGHENGVGKDAEEESGDVIESDMAFETIVIEDEVEEEVPAPKKRRIN
ncbi:ubiquitin-activating enzyme E1-like [[Candida] railenensis]|uniref:Ubiquitin-activating enzyme E1-like n=1 Tax=[Candida] railenensis TaxID=45579 RepID=A0A9P0VVN2_9ASCO|nr:ubiquitin-activating enzyme E1-like [[Candida] railenensis]